MGRREHLGDIFSQHPSVILRGGDFGSASLFFGIFFPWDYLSPTYTHTVSSEVDEVRWEGWWIRKLEL